MVFRIFKNKNFTTMSNYFLRDKNLSWKGKGALAVMLSNCDDWKYTLSGLCAMVPDKETATKSALDELKKLGYLEVIKHMPGETESGRIEYEYRIYEIPKDKVEQEYKKQGLEILGVEKQGLEIPGLRNTNEETIDKRKIIEEGKKDIYSSDDSYISKEKSESPSKKKRFTGINPTLDQVETLIKAKGYHFDARDIIRYYTSDGEYDVWRFRDGRLVKDWKRCCITFEDRWQEKFGNGYKPSAKTFQPSDYDEEADKRHIEELIRKQRESYQEMVERGEINEYDRVPY